MVSLGGVWWREVYQNLAFLIEIHNKLDYKTYLTTLVHELWHVYQHVKGLPQCEEEAAIMEKVLFNKISCLNIQAS